MAVIGSRWRSERGAELIEFAIVMPMLLFIIAGIVDFGMMFRDFEVVTNAAREGARVGVLPGYDVPDVQARVNAYFTAAGLTGWALANVCRAAAQPRGQHWRKKAQPSRLAP